MHGKEPLFPELEWTEVTGIAVAKVTEETLPALVERLVEAPGSRLFSSVNVDICNQAQQDEQLRKYLLEAPLVYSDGAGVVLGSWIAGEPLAHRVTSIHLLWSLCDRWRNGEHSFYFLGCPPGVAEAARDVIRARFPNVDIAGCHHGYLQDPEVLEAVLRDIEAKSPDVLCVGFGTPLQEHFILKHRERLKGVSIFWPVGALFEHIAKVRPRAPKWMRRSGLEWAWRLSLEPTRLWKRYLLGNPAFVGRVVRDRIRASR